MKITHQREGQTVVVALAEELDHHSARRTIDEISRQVILYPDCDFILDLKELTFMDSSGLAVVLHFHRMVTRGGHSFAVRHVPPAPMRVFRAARLERMVTFLKSGEDTQA